MKKQSLLYLCSLGLVVLTTWAPESEAWRLFNNADCQDEVCTQGCQEAGCHAVSFLRDDYTSNNALDVVDWGMSLHEGHKLIAGGKDFCFVCHGSPSPQLNDKIDLAVYCSDCHGRDETQAGDGDPPSSAGLRQHHVRTEAVLPDTAEYCTNCHDDSSPSTFTPVGEDVQPPSYAIVSLDACNPASATRPESQFGNLGLDNDGDTDYDQVDRDCLDTDNDGVPDIDDNCTIVKNADQRDTDGDGFGNVCDGDLNGDLVVGTFDVGLFRDALGSSEADANYNPDADFDGDGTVGTSDVDAFRIFVWGEPGPAGEL